MVGIIAEYNPFHNGHLYHLKKVKEMFPDEVIVLVLAGNFLNRGDVSIINKWDKTDIALKYGVDLVVELPTVFSVQSADLYAYAAINILNNLSCDYLVFGSESNNIERLIEVSDILVNNNLDEEIRKYTKKGLNYPASLARVLKEKYDIEINQPNDLLAISYIKEIKKIKSKIKPISIKRTNDYHSLKLKGKIVSATSIRNAIKNGKRINKYVPKEVTKHIKKIDLENYFNILKHQIIINDLTKYQDIDENISNSFKKNINNCNSIEQLINKVKSKNYTYNKIKRCLIHILLNLTKKDYKLEYIRILGFNQKGKEYLNKIKKNTNIPLLSSYNECLNFELQASNIYSIIANSDINDELKKPIIYKD